MKKLLILLKKLSRKEFREFLAYFAIVKKSDKKTNAEKLLNYIEKYYPKFEAKQLEDKVIHQEIFGSSSFKKQQIDKVAYQLSKELKRFLVWQSDEDSFEKELILLKKYKAWNLPTQIKLQLNKMEKQIEQDKNESWYPYKKMRLAHERYFDPRPDKLKDPADALHDAMSSLDNFHAFFKLFYASEILSIQQVRNEPLPQIQLFEQVQELLTEPTTLNIRAVQLTILLLQTGEEKIYKELKNLVFENIDEFSQEHKHVLFTRLLNQNSYWIKEGKDFYIKEYFKLLKLGVTAELFITNGIFNTGHFDNIVDIACKLKEFRWLEEFIKKTSLLLKEESREETLIFSKAFTHFGKGEFDKTLALLLNYQPKTLFNKARLWMLLIASNFELKSDENTILDLCLNCNKFVRRSDKMTSKMKTNILNFTKMIMKLAKSIDSIQEINLIEPIFFKTWLVEKINQRKRKREQY